MLFSQRQSQSAAGSQIDPRIHPTRMAHRSMFLFDFRLAVGSVLVRGAAADNESIYEYGLWTMEHTKYRKLFEEKKYVKLHLTEYSTYRSLQLHNDNTQHSGRT